MEAAKPQVVQPMAPHTPRAPRADGHSAARGYLARAWRSTGTLAGFEVINKAARFGAAVVMARLLPLHDYGLVNVGIAISGIWISLTSLGLPEIGARRLAIDPSATNQTATAVIAIRACIILLSLTLLLAAASAISLETMTIIAGAGLMSLGMAISGDWALRGREQMRAAGTANALGGIVVLIAVSVLSILMHSPVLILGGFALGEFTTSIYTLSKLRVKFAPVTVSAAIALVRRSWPLGASSLIIYAYYANLDTVLLSAMHSASAAGLYSAPYRVFLAFSSIGPFAAYSFLPILSNARNGPERNSVQRALAVAAFGLAAYGMIALGMAEFAGRELLSALFGSRFSSMQAVLVILCLGISWYTMALPVAYGFIADQTNWRFVKGAAVAGIINLILNFLLIPPFGALGAAIGTTSSFAAAALTWIALSRRGTGFVLLVLCLPVIATAGALLALFAPSTARPVGAATLAIGVAAIVGSVKGGFVTLSTRRPKGLQDG